MERLAQIRSSSSIQTQKTLCYSAINCCPSTSFHGREPIKPLNIRVSRKIMDAVAVNFEFVNELQDAML